MKTLMIIGNGIAAKQLRLRLKDKFEIIQIASEDFAPSCSKTSTGIVALRNTESGISDLGDRIRNSFFEFEEFVNEHNPSGVEEITHSQIWGEQSPKNEMWDRRFENFELKDSVEGLNLKNKMKVNSEKGYLIYPDEYLRWHGSDELIDDYIKEIIPGKRVRAVGQKGEYEADLAICCSSSFSKFYINDERIERTRPVKGSYLVFNTKLPHSFSLTIEKHNLLYRKKTSELIIGATSEDCGFEFLADMGKLEEIYTQVISYFDYEFPHFEDAHVLTGLRHKGVKRMPFWGKVDGENIYSVDGLYKNGWSFSVLAARELVEELSEFLDV